MKIKKHSGIYSFTINQVLPISIEEAWDFFSTPENLSKITPSEMGFNITSSITEKIFAGQIITYKIGILPLIKSNWVTEITQVNSPNYFIDEQRFGPYKMWHHQHIFVKKENSIEMKDVVHFKLPFGFIGHLAFHLFVKNKLNKIFLHRKDSLSKYFKK